MKRALLGATAAALALSVVVAPSAVAAATDSGVDGHGCQTWTKTRVASGFGILENLAFDGSGGLLLSEQTALGPGGALKRLSADGETSTVTGDVTGPGGILVDGRTAYLATGNTLSSGLLGRKDGTVDAVDLDTGEHSTVASGLTQPNGLERLPDGRFVTSRDFGSPTTLSAVAPGSQPTPFATSVTLTNGLAVGPDGSVYVALNVRGTVVRLDPDSGTVCTIATGLPLASAVAFGSGPGWDAQSLYVTSFAGTVTRLTP